MSKKKKKNNTNHMEFGVPHNMEKATVNKELRQRAETLIKLANVGKTFTDIMAQAKTEKDFLNACSKLYQIYQNKSKEENNG